MKMKKHHWITSDQLRNRFWSHAYRLGLDMGDVVAALGTCTISGYNGTAEEAMEALTRYADKKRPPAKQ